MCKVKIYRCKLRGRIKSTVCIRQSMMIFFFVLSLKNLATDFVQLFLSSKFLKQAMGKEKLYYV